MPSTTPRSRQELQVSSYDKVSGWIVALLVVAGVTVGALFLVYITSHFVIGQFATPVTPVATGGGGVGGTGPLTSAELDPPEATDTSAFDEPLIQETLTAVTSAVTARTAILVDDQLEQLEKSTKHGDNRSPGAGGGRGGGIGGGIGAGFGPGRGGKAEPRREIRYEPSSLLEYAQWLDFFKIELGILNQEENKVYYAKNLSQQRPEVYTGEPGKEQRLFMHPTDSEFVALNRQLATKAGIAGKGEIILHFYPLEAQAVLNGLEQAQAKASNRGFDQIRGTVFRVTRTGTKFEFSVIEQTYR